MRLIEAITPKRYADGKLYRLDLGWNGRGGSKFPKRSVRRELNASRPKDRKLKRPKRSFVFSIQFGPGNGYCRWNDDRTKMVVRGRIFYFGWRSGSRQWAKDFRAREQTGLGRIAWFTPLEIGLTKRAKSIYLAS